MTFSTRNFDPLPPLAPKSPKFCIISFLLLEIHCFRHHIRYKLIFILLGYEELLAKNNFKTKIGRVLG